ncbi:MAG: terpene cyclase/mutase family protein [Planctomycetes bacterium]|nr:terpene cyclase/mutase family protein [Planctomycetota bacterium]
MESGNPRTGTVDYVKSFVRNSPWISISAFVHVIIFSALSIFYVTREEPRPAEVITQIAVGTKPVAVEPVEAPPELIDRKSVPVLPNEQEGIVNPDDNYIPHAIAGRQGEITDETRLDREAGIYNPDPDALANVPSGATGGTPIGVGKIGHHGTAPSAFASRRAGGGGRGGGGLGQGGGGGRGGGRTTEGATLAALEWLKNHQSPEGRWDCDGFGGQCKKGACSGPGYSNNDIGVTGLALLCFLGAGETHQSGNYKDVVKRGLKYLMSVQDEDGCFGQRVGHHFIYNHACAALAMTEAFGMTQAKAFKDPAQKSINFILKAQNPYAAWRYAFPPDGDNDVSVTGWMLMALKSAKASGLTIDEGQATTALTWIESMTDQQSGRTGYNETGGRSSRQTELMKVFPAELTESMTAVGVLSRIFGGHTLESDPMIGKGGELMVARAPKWDTKSGEIDFYYWYYGTLAMFQVGGDRWNRWNEAMKDAILDNQRMKEGECEYGSWDPIDPWSPAGGRVYSTAVLCLCMEVYYRYPRVFGTSKRRKSGTRPNRRTQRRFAAAAAPALGSPLAPVAVRA